MNEQPRIIKRKELDVQKWDHCIDRSDNGLIYAYSDYLDYMSKNWEALVLGDYAVVMPLTWNKKWGLHYLYQPPFTASLGIFGNDLDANTITAFLKAIPEKYKLIEIDLNYGNVIAPLPNGCYHRMNYILPLYNSYEELRANYRDNVKRNCKKAEAAGCIYKENINENEVMALAIQYSIPGAKLGHSEQENFLSLITALRKKGMVEVNGIYNNSGELLSSAVYFLSHGRAYYILVGNHPNGKTLGASHWLIDRFIATHAAQKLILDFEGSDTRNLAFFYSGFGAKEELYPAYKLNRLPWWAKWAKK